MSAIPLSQPDITEGDIQAVVAALGPVTNGEVRVLALTGNLKEEYGGTPIYGEDVMIIRSK